MKEHKEGTLKSSSGKKVNNRKQAIAIALNEAREAGAKIRKKKSWSDFPNPRTERYTCLKRNRTCAG